MPRKIVSIIITSLFVLPVACLSDDAGGLDAHIRAACPAAAAWKDAHDKIGNATAIDRLGFVPANPKLRDELKLMAKRDQDARDKWQADAFSVKSSAFSQVKEVDAENLPQLKSIFSGGSFPTYQEVGADGVESAWLLLQHADADPSMQERVLKTLNPRSLPEGISEKDFSLLVDRVQMNENKPQIYGTQFHKVADKWVPYPIFEASKVDERRRDLGLMPLSMYTCAITAASTYKGNYAKDFPCMV